jgi:hypothetical protein
LPHPHLAPLGIFWNFVACGATKFPLVEQSFPSGDFVSEKPAGA